MSGFRLQKPMNIKQMNNITTFYLSYSVFFYQIAKNKIGHKRSKHYLPTEAKRQKRSNRCDTAEAKQQMRSNRCEATDAKQQK